MSRNNLGGRSRHSKGAKASSKPSATLKRYSEKDRRIPKRKEFNTQARSKLRNGKGPGKFTWGDELEDLEEYYYDEQDYEEYQQEAEMAEAFDEFASGAQRFQQELREYKIYIKSVIREFFEHGETDDVLQALFEYDDARFNYEFVKRAISMSLDRRNREREMVSQMIAILCESNFLRSEDIADGFIGLFEQISELKLDCPNAERLVAKFLARAITDECLPPRYLERGAFIEAGGKAVEEAKVLLSMKHGTSRMERVWGSSAFQVNDLKKEIKDLVREYIISEDLAEAAQCVRDLDSRNFHHEVVKRAVEISMDYGIDKQKRVALFLQTLHVEEIIHPTQFVIGFKRLFENLPSLKCDVPAAEMMLNGFVAHGRKTGYLPATYMPPTWLEAQTSEDEDNDDAASTKPSFPDGFTAEIAEQMAEFESLSPRTDKRIVDSIGVPDDVIAAAHVAGIDSDLESADSSEEESSSDDEDDDIANEYEVVEAPSPAQGQAQQNMASNGLNLLQAGLRGS